MPTPGDKVVFLRAFQGAIMGDKGVVTAAETDTLSGRAFQRLTIAIPDKRDVSLTFCRTAKIPTIQVLPNQK
jgi:hypothetical protein